MVVTHVEKKDQFDTAINGDQLTVVDFYATWCGPCKQISPYLETLSNSADYAQVTFLKVDVDKHAELSEHQGISAMPTFLCYKKGKKVGELVGASQPKLKELLDKHK